MSFVWRGLKARKETRTFGLKTAARDRPRSAKGINMNFDLKFKIEEVGKQVFERAPVDVLEEEVECFQGRQAFSSEEKVKNIFQGKNYESATAA